MRLVNMTCPNCGAQLQIDADRIQVFCEHCGTKLLLQDEVHHIKYDDAENAGYMFEKGRQRAIAEAQAQRQNPDWQKSPAWQQNPGYGQQNPRYGQQSVNRQTPGKRRTWLWVLGWLFIFPLPLTILLNRKKDMEPVLKYAIIAIAWIVYICWVGSNGG